jgi:hypothetical protein
MTAAIIRILARFEIAERQNYCLWAVKRRTRSHQKWEFASLHYGRTDSVNQALGEISLILGDLPVDAIRNEPLHISWKKLRKLIGGDIACATFEEGKQQWDVRKATLAIVDLEASGKAFNEAIQAAYQRRLEDWRVKHGNDNHNGFRATGSEKTALAVLGLEPDATLGDVKRKYRRLVAVHHPDRGGKGSEFVRIRKAYERLQHLNNG